MLSGAERSQEARFLCFDRFSFLEDGLLQIYKGSSHSTNMMPSRAQSRSQSSCQVWLQQQQLQQLQ